MKKALTILTLGLSISCATFASAKATSHKSTGTQDGSDKAWACESAIFQAMQNAVDYCGQLESKQTKFTKKDECKAVQTNDEDSPYYYVSQTVHFECI